VSSNNSRRRPSFGRRPRRCVEAAERLQDEEELPNPMRPDGWVRWLELQRALESAEIQIAKIRRARTGNTMRTLAVIFAIVLVVIFGTVVILALADFALTES
jgi:hypothetical protein